MLHNNNSSLHSVCRYSSDLFTICISNDNNVYSFGKSSYGAHGFDKNYVFPPKQIPNLLNIISISCGLYHVLCLDFNGDVFSFGRNNHGQLGISKSEKELKHTHIPQQLDISSIKQISCGELFSICLSSDGYLYSFGVNTYGQLALGNNSDVNSPQEIPDFNNIDFIVCGGDHSICKTYDNEFYSWGYNKYGQLGQGNTNDCNKPIQCFNWPENIIDIKCGYIHSLLLTSEGQVYSFGDNTTGSLGINDKNIKSLNIPTLIQDIPEIIKISCGSKQSLCIDINNSVWLFGSNIIGQLGLGDKNHRYKPTKHPKLSNIIDISSGGFSTFVKTIDNKIYSFGHNNNKQIGIKTSVENQLTPIQVLEDKEEIWCSFTNKSRAKSARK